MHLIIPWVVGLGVALAGMLCSALLVWHQLGVVEQMTHARFVQSANALTDVLLRRIDAYSEIAYGLRSLFVVNPALGRRDFLDATAQLEVDARYPGVKNIAFTRYVRAEDKVAFEQAVRADTSVNPAGYPDFAIRPHGARSEYFVADYLWPLSGNQGVHGLDISAQPVNLESMRHSMRSGDPVASGPFDLIQESVHKTGFVVRVPVFQKSSQLHPSGQFLGAVAVTVRIFDLFTQLEREGHVKGLRLALSDTGSAITPQGGTAPMLMYSTLDKGIESGESFQREFGMYGRNWRMEFQPAMAFSSPSEVRSPWLFGVAGVLLSIFLGGLFFALTRARVQAMARAAQADTALHVSEGRWQYALDESKDGLWDLDIPSSTVFYSPRWKSMLGYFEGEIGNALAHWIELIHPDDRESFTAAMRAHWADGAVKFECEYRMRCRDRSWRLVCGRGVVLSRDTAGQALRMIGTQSDVEPRPSGTAGG